MADSIVWEGDLTDKLNQFGPRVKRAMVAGAKYIEPRALTHMKDNAPWNDITGNARNGLKADTVIERNSVHVVLYHTVPYGVYLETRWSGRYQIINPTITLFAPELIKIVSELAFD